MLKRQRAISPPPSLDVPLITPDPIDLSSHHGAKRRRVAAPVLDGEKRGWGVEMDANNLEDDEDDEYSYEDADDEGRGPESGGDGQRDSFGAAETYKSTNSILHDLHALHQHRMIFSNNSYPTPPPSQSYQPPPSSSLQLSSSKRPSYPSHTPAKSVLPPLSERPPIESPGLDPNLSNDPISLDPHELRRVKERYEDTNRLLGSLVLSRRKELQSSSTSDQHHFGYS